RSAFPLIPFERSLLPFVDETHDEDEQEDAHRDETEDTDLPQHDGPGKQENDLEIEDDEEDGDEVVTHVELRATVFERLETAFITRQLLRITTLFRLPSAEHKAERHQDEREARCDGEEDQYGQVIR